MLDDSLTAGNLLPWLSYKLLAALRLQSLCPPIWSVIVALQLRPGLRLRLLFLVVSGMKEPYDV